MIILKGVSIRIEKDLPKRKHEITLADLSSYKKKVD